MTDFEELPKRLRDYLRAGNPSSDRPEDEEEPNERRGSLEGERKERSVRDWLRCPNCGSENVSVASQLDGLGYIETEVWCTDCDADAEQRTGESVRKKWGPGRR